MKKLDEGLVALLTLIGIFGGAILLIVGLIMLARLEPVRFGQFAGVISALGFALATTSLVLSVSNDIGSGEGKFEDFTEKPLEILEQEIIEK